MANLNHMGSGRQLLKTVMELNGTKGKHLTNLPKSEAIKAQKNSHSPISKATKK